MKFQFIIIVTCILFAFQAKAQKSMFEHFVTRSGAKLMDGERELRFVSFNIPNLNYIEDEFGYEQAQPFRLPDAFEIRDALLSAKQMGGDVVRLYTIPVRSRHDHPETPGFVLGPGIFDEEAFRSLDLVLAIANEVGVRVIIPFINNWQWMGGRPQYADFRNKANDSFWSDPQLINDARATIAYVINRVNTLTGAPYKEDKAILCWETGNELTCPESWTAEMCRFIKQLDANHLVMDGFFAIDGIPLRRSSLSDPNIDIVSSHHYETDPTKLMAHINRNLAIVNGEKPYVLGEFGFISNGAMRQVLDHVINTGMPGALWWSLRFHRREGGFYWHSEPSGHGRFKAYLWPGFETGTAYDEKNTLALMREKAYAIKGIPPPTLPAPAPPRLLPITEVSRISWQGAVGAAAYDVERAANPEGPWEIVGYNISDAAAQYFPLFNDRTALKGASYYYRVVAKNQSGNSRPSNVVGPVGAGRLAP
jgi:mannan endo-1,4-beta-mannosidase